MAALVSFRIQTAATSRTCHLFGSWDSFQIPHAMAKDPNSGPGCYHGTFPGLKMGGSYTYYYIVDSCKMIHDPTSRQIVKDTTGRTLSVLHVPLQVGVQLAAPVARSVIPPTPTPAVPPNAARKHFVVSTLQRPTSTAASTQSRRRSMYYAMPATSSSENSSSSDLSDSDAEYSSDSSCSSQPSTSSSPDSLHTKTSSYTYSQRGASSALELCTCAAYSGPHYKNSHTSNTAISHRAIPSPYVAASYSAPRKPSGYVYPATLPSRSPYSSGGSDDEALVARTAGMRISVASTKVSANSAPVTSRERSAVATAGSRRYGYVSTT